MLLISDARVMAFAGEVFPQPVVLSTTFAPLPTSCLPLLKSDDPSLASPVSRANTCRPSTFKRNAPPGPPKIGSSPPPLRSHVFSVHPPRQMAIASVPLKKVPSPSSFYEGSDGEEVHADGGENGPRSWRSGWGALCFCVLCTCMYPCLCCIHTYKLCLYINFHAHSFRHTYTNTQTHSAAHVHITVHVKMFLLHMQFAFVFVNRLTQSMTNTHTRHHTRTHNYMHTYAYMHICTHAHIQTSPHSPTLVHTHRCIH